MNPKQKEWAKTILIFVVSLVLIFIGLQLTGCSPYAEYRHISDPRISGDGYDLLCGGAQHATQGFEIHGGLCRNVHGGEYVQAGVKYVWD